MNEPSGTPTDRYPLTITGELDPAPSRWLWLVKIILVLPHVIVLAFLWIALFFTTIAAGISILFTRRYPRSLFEFAVGVVRWTWRVTFYSTGAFGTDRYPPFSLASQADYPADLQVEYPVELSRGKVLIKSWLLAFPHLLLVGIFAGGAGWHAGLISLLALIAAFSLLFTGRYPTKIFDLVMGFNRWVFRVTAYVLLMTDTYPPFRLDQGPTEQGVPTPPPTPGPRTNIVGQAEPLSTT